MPETAHRYNLIASAVAGRAITVHWHNNPSLLTYTDSQSIFLNSTGSGSSRSLEVIAQALLIRVGSLRRNIVQRLIGRKKLADRYLYAEVCRAAREYAHLLPRQFCEMPEVRQFPHATTSSQSSLRLANSRREFPDMPAFLGSLRSVLILKKAIPQSALAALTKKQQQGKFEISDLPELSADQEDEAEESKILKMFQNPLMSGGALSKMLNDILGAGRTGKPEDDPNAGGGAESPVGNIVQAQKKGLFATLTDLAFDLVAAPDRQDAGTRSYPEWDYVKERYRADWTMVDEMDPWREEPESEEALAALLRPPAAGLKRKLAGIGLSVETHRNQQDGEDYTLDRVIDYFVDQRMGVTPDDRLFDQRLSTRRDLAVMLLLDISGSTGEKDADGQSVHHQQMQLAFHLMTALHELGDHVSLYAFHSWGRTLVRLLRLKSFKERVIDSRVRRRFASLEPVGYTRTGAALRHAASKLRHETGLPYCLLIVVTDGFSYDQDYEGKYGEEDTKKALEEVRSAGMGCLCLTIASSQEEAKLQQVYGAASTLSVRDYDEFLLNIRPAVLRAIRHIRS